MFFKIRIFFWFSHPLASSEINTVLLKGRLYDWLLTFCIRRKKSIKKLEHGNLIFHKNLKNIFNDLWRKRALSMDNLTVKKVICSYLLKSKDKVFENTFFDKTWKQSSPMNKKLYKDWIILSYAISALKHELVIVQTYLARWGWQKSMFT